MPLRYDEIEEVKAIVREEVANALAAEKAKSVDLTPPAEPAKTASADTTKTSPDVSAEAGEQQKTFIPEIKKPGGTKGVK